MHKALSCSTHVCSFFSIFWLLSSANCKMDSASNSLVEDSSWVKKTSCAPWRRIDWTSSAEKPNFFSFVKLIDWISSESNLSRFAARSTILSSTLVSVTNRKIRTVFFCPEFRMMQSRMLPYLAVAYLFDAPYQWPADPAEDWSRYHTESPCRQLLNWCRHHQRELTAGRETLNLTGRNKQKKELKTSSMRRW